MSLSQVKQLHVFTCAVSVSLTSGFPEAGPEEEGLV